MLHLNSDVDYLADEGWVEWARDADVVAGVAFHHALAVCALEENLLGHALV